MATLCAASLSLPLNCNSVLHRVFKDLGLRTEVVKGRWGLQTVRAIRRRHLTAETQGHSKPSQCGIVTDQVAPGQVSLRLPLLSPITIIPLIIRSPPSTFDITHTILATNSAVKQHTNSYGLTLHVCLRVSLYLHSVIDPFPIVSSRAFLRARHGMTYTIAIPSSLSSACPSDQHHCKYNLCVDRTLLNNARAI